MNDFIIWIPILFCLGIIEEFYSKRNRKKPLLKRIPRVMFPALLLTVGIINVDHSKVDYVMNSFGLAMMLLLLLVVIELISIRIRAHRSSDKREL